MRWATAINGCMSPDTDLTESVPSAERSERVLTHSTQGVGGRRLTKAKIVVMHPPIHTQNVF